MALNVSEVIEIDENRDEIDEEEENFILEFDPSIDFASLKLISSQDVVDLHVVAEKGLAYCRDHPHPRHTCTNLPFETTSPDRHCEMCCCYVCDLPAPCSKWSGSAGHCHAFDNEAWNLLREWSRKEAKMALKGSEAIEIDDSSLSPEEECYILEVDPHKKSTSSKDVGNAEVDLQIVAEKGPVACRDYPHSRNNCANYHFEKTSHDRYCELCYCYVCDLPAPCSNWSEPAGHCHAFDHPVWNEQRRSCRNGFQGLQSMPQFF